jgi:hypothetical protein
MHIFRLIAIFLLAERVFCLAGKQCRRQVLLKGIATLAPIITAAPPVSATKDCFLDCSQNCNRLAPKSGAYCTLTCRDYCEQPDRKDGLSGSVGSEGAEVGFRSAFDLISKAKGQVSGVPYGEDRPPQVLPRDFLGIDKLPLNGDEMRSRSLK